MRPLFKEKSGNYVVVYKSACFQIPQYFSENGEVFDPYFYRGKRYTNEGIEDEPIVSSVYFSGKGAKCYGSYGPYFYILDADELQRMFNHVIT